MSYTPEQFSGEFLFFYTGNATDEQKKRVNEQIARFAEGRGMTLEQYLHEVFLPSAEYRQRIAGILRQCGDTPLLEIEDLPASITTPLKTDGVMTVIDVMERGDKALLTVQGIGEKRLHRLKEVLQSRFGLFPSSILQEDQARWKKEMKEQESK